MTGPSPAAGPARAERDARRPPLTTGHRVLVGVHVALAVVAAGTGLLGARDASGWADLARFLLGLLVAVWLVGLVAGLLVARFALRGPLARAAVLALAPPAALAAGVAVLRQF